MIIGTVLLQILPFSVEHRAGFDGLAGYSGMTSIHVYFIPLYDYILYM